MIFRKCSIGGKMYNGDATEEEEEDTSSVAKKSAALVSGDKSPPPSYTIGKRDKIPLDSDIPMDDLRSSGSSTAAYQPTSGGATRPLKTDEDPNAPADTAEAPPKVKHRFRDAELTNDLLSSINADPNSEGAAHARQLNGFFTVLALCHTVLTNLDPVTGHVEYKAQSPDEAALVQAAADMGYVFKGREREVLYLQTPFQNVGGVSSVEGGECEELGYGRRSSETTEAGGNGSGAPGTATATAADGTLERYELLNILEFTSARKRMSVVLRKLDGDDGRLFLLTKGADNVIFERLKEGANEDLKATTEKHLDEFASQGLRTLTLAYRVVSGVFHPFFFRRRVGSFFVFCFDAEAEYQPWSERYHEATVSTDDRDAKIEAVADELERDLRLLGATAIEDRLQDGVPEAIADLKHAGIKVWVATGDKLETAIGVYPAAFNPCMIVRNLMLMMVCLFFFSWDSYRP
jgi:phospholipid-translocating ATPase